MNGEPPKIEIFTPFGDAYEVMKKILFQPFDMAKWLVLGFAAFLSGHHGGGFGFSFPTPGDWNFKSTSKTTGQTFESFPSWVIPVVIAAGLIVVVLVLLFMWIKARGGFIFTDCLVRNRAAIVAPWKEYRREGNSLFLFNLLVLLLALIVLALVASIYFVPVKVFSITVTKELRIAGVIGLILVALGWCLFSIFFAIVTAFMVPVMYRRRCRATEAFFAVSRLLLAHPGPFALFVLFGMVLLLALVIIGTIASCVTCCIGALPYVSSVVLLPAFVWLVIFKLLFLRQFGPEFDVWAMVEVPAPILPEAPLADEPPPEAPPPIE